MLLAACGGDDTVIPPTATITLTPRPSLTPTLRSTPLPTVASPVPVGTEGLPIKIAFVGRSSAAITRSMRDLEAALTEETSDFLPNVYNGLKIEVIRLDNAQEALTLLCNSRDTAVFVDIFTFMAAERDCGAVSVFQIQKGTGVDATTGTNFELIVNRTRISSVTQLIRTDRNTRFCTPSIDSLVTFVHPTLALRAIAGQIPTTQVRADSKIDLLNGTTIQIVTSPFVNDVEMVQGLQGGGNTRICESAALPAGRFAEIQAQLNADNQQRTIADVGVFEFPEDQANLQWPEIPYGVLAFPNENQFSTLIREEVVEAFSAIQEDGGETQRDLNNLVEHDALLPVTPETFNAFRDWLRLAGWDMAPTGGR